MSTAVENAKAVPDAPPSPTAAKNINQEKQAKEQRESEIKQELKEMIKEEAQAAKDDLIEQAKDEAKEELKGHVTDLYNEGASEGWFSSMFSCSCKAPEMPNIEMPNMEMPEIPDMEELKRKAVVKAAESAGLDPELALAAYEVSQDPVGKGKEFIMEYGKEKLVEYLEAVGLSGDIVDTLMEKIEEKVDEKIDEKLEELAEGDEDETKDKKAKDKKDDKKDAKKGDNKQEKKDKKDAKEGTQPKTE